MLPQKRDRVILTRAQGNTEVFSGGSQGITFGYKLCIFKGANLQKLL